MTSPLSLSHNGRPALTNSTRSVEPPKASLWSKDGDDAAALQLLRPRFTAAAAVATRAFAEGER